MDILHHKDGICNSLIKKTFTFPTILLDGASCLYILIKDINEELEKFIDTGITDQSGGGEPIEFRALPNEVELMMENEWIGLGFMTTYHSQNIFYMRKTVKVIYPRISNPETCMGISLIPWFMLPDRRLPVFIHLFAIWYYHETGERSLEESAAATGKMFRIDSYNKSTVSRNIKAFENFMDISKIGGPLIIDEPEGPSDKEMIGCISEILLGFKSIKELEGQYGKYIKNLPKPIRQTIKQILSVIPDKYTKIIKGEEPEHTKPRDGRARPPRARNKEAGRVQRRFKFADFAQVEEMRMDFIKYCRRLVMDAAVKHHRFLI
jgi:hypothetical protein